MATQISFRRESPTMAMVDRQLSPHSLIHHCVYAEATFPLGCNVMKHGSTLAPASSCHLRDVLNGKPALGFLISLAKSP